MSGGSEVSGISKHLPQSPASAAATLHETNLVPLISKVRCTKNYMNCVSNMALLNMMRSRFFRLAGRPWIRSRDRARNENVAEASAATRHSLLAARQSAVVAGTEVV